MTVKGREMRKMGTPKARSVAVVALLATALLAASCTTNPPADGRTMTFEARRITNTNFKIFWPPTFWHPDPNIQQPFLVHLGLRLTLTPEVKVHTFVRSTYLNGGRTIGDIGANQTLDVRQGDGVTFGGVKLPDTFDLANGVPFEILGSVELLLERRQLIPLGIANVLQGVSQVINQALPPILAKGGLPSEPAEILDFLGKLLPGVLATVGGAIAAVIGGLTGGDNVVGINIPLSIAVGGGLGDFIHNALPTLVNVVNFALSLQDPNPFPDGLPFTLGVVGHGMNMSYGKAPASAYRLNYGWRYN